MLRIRFDLPRTQESIVPPDAAVAASSNGFHGFLHWRPHEALPTVSAHACGPQPRASDSYNAASSRLSIVARTGDDLPSDAPGRSTRAVSRFANSDLTRRYTCNSIDWPRFQGFLSRSPL
jgi:hypothetical protein